MTTVLRANDVYLSRGDRPVLKGASISVDAGEIVALVGPNGAGKTTLMTALLGQLEPSRGEVSVELPGRVGWVPQGGATYSRLTVRENVELFLQLRGIRSDRERLALEAIDEAQLTPWTNHQGNELSGGLRQRLNVAIGLLEDPPAILLDEPTTGVDLAHRSEMFDLLRQRARRGRSVLYTTHSLEDAAVADRVVVLANGRDVWTGQLEDLAKLAPATGDPRVEFETRSLSPVARGLLTLWASDEQRSGART